MRRAITITAPVMATIPMAASNTTTGGRSSSKKARDPWLASPTMVSAVIAVTSRVFHGTKGRLTMARANSPMAVSTMTAVVLACSSDTSSAMASWYPAKAARVAMMPVGTANRRTRPTKPGRVRFADGARARKNDGIPMVTAPIRVRCLGRKGKGTVARPTARAIPMA